MGAARLSISGKGDTMRVRSPPSHTVKGHTLISESHANLLAYPRHSGGKGSDESGNRKKAKEGRVKGAFVNEHLPGQTPPPGGGCYIMHSHAIG